MKNLVYSCCKYLNDFDDLEFEQFTEQKIEEFILTVKKFLYRRY